MVAPATSTLQTIQTKVRRLTRSPSVALLSDADLQQYINTFVIYDFPEHLRTFFLRKPFTFVCNPFQSEYVLDDTYPITAQLYDFQNRYISIHTPVYIAGFPAFYSQNREEFFGIYPQVNSLVQGPQTGDGVTTTFTGVINTAQSFPINPLNGNQLAVLEQRQVTISSLDTNFNGISLIDVPLQNGATGFNTVFGNLYDPTLGVPTGPLYYPADLLANNNINYLTGQYTATFTSAPGTGQPVITQTVPLVTARPQAMLFHDNKIRLRPIPDQPYRINFEVYARPTQLLETDQNPDLNEWWQYIAYGAAKKVFEDRMDLESVQLIMPEYKKQETLVLRRTIVQNTNERAATIYTDGLSGQLAGSGWGFGGTGQF